MELLNLQILDILEKNNVHVWVRGDNGKEVWTKEELANRIAYELKMRDGSY